MIIVLKYSTSTHEYEDKKQSKNSKSNIVTQCINLNIHMY